MKGACAASLDGGHTHSGCVASCGPDDELTEEDKEDADDDSDVSGLGLQMSRSAPQDLGHRAAIAAFVAWVEFVFSVSFVSMQLNTGEMLFVILAAS